jgi:hypothetical protein
MDAAQLPAESGSMDAGPADSGSSQGGSMEAGPDAALPMDSGGTNNLDSGPGDSGSRDAGIADAGFAPTDSGPADSGIQALDAAGGQADAGDPGNPDAALVDAGGTDSGPGPTPDGGNPIDAGPPIEVAQVVFGNLANTNFFTRGYLDDGSFGPTSSVQGGLSHAGSFVELRLGPKNLDGVRAAQAGNGNHFDWWHKPSGSNWAHDGFTGIGAGAGTRKAVDLEVEGISGEVVMVASDDANPSPNFWVWNGMDWSMSAPIFSSGSEPGSGLVEWVQLVADPGSDQMVLLYADANADLFALQWDGDGWDLSGVRTWETDLMTLDHQAFDGVFIPDTGDFVAAWGQAGFEGLKSASKANANIALPSTASSTVVAKAIPGVVRMVARSGGTVAALAWLDLGAGGGVVPRLGGAMWNSTAWIDVATIDTSIVDFTAQLGTPRMAVAMLPNAERAVVVYDDTIGDNLEWATWNAQDGWAVQAPVNVGGILDNIDRIEALAIPATGEVLFLIDNGPSLFAFAFDGLDWAIPTGGDPVAPSVNDTGVPVYGFSAWP